MALLGAAQVACPGRSRRVELAHASARLREASLWDSTGVVDADGDVGHYSGLYVARNCDTVTNTVWISTIGSPVSGEGAMFPCASW
jgi:hypothetical protein